MSNLVSFFMKVDITPEEGWKIFRLKCHVNQSLTVLIFLNDDESS